MSTRTVVDETLAAWPKPEPLGEDLLPVPALDLAMLPEAFREHVSDVAERMQVPVTTHTIPQSGTPWLTVAVTVNHMRKVTATTCAGRRPCIFSAGHVPV